MYMYNWCLLHVYCDIHILEQLLFCYSTIYVHGLPEAETTSSTTAVRSFMAADQPGWKTPE